MNRADAIRRVKALRNVTVEHGATASEAATAARKASQITSKFGLADVDTRSVPPPRPIPRAPRRRSPSMRGAFFPFPVVPGFQFNVNTAEHSDNVKVHHYHHRGNWRIEIFDQ